MPITMIKYVIITAVGLLYSASTGTATAEPHLTGRNAQEIERLLAVPKEKRAVYYSDRRLPRSPVHALDRYLMWNEIALDTTAIDHTPVDTTTDEDPRRFGEQFGPHRSSYAMAIVHIAMFEAINAITTKYQSYVGLAPVRRLVSMDRAIVQAAHDTLVALYPHQAGRIDALFVADTEKIHGVRRALRGGAELGARAAKAILAKRENDGSELPEPRIGDDYVPSDEPGAWQPDPVSGLLVALGGNWPKVKPFVLTSAAQFRPGPPPRLTDTAYTEAYEEVKRIGGDPAHETSTSRTASQTFTGLFWAYDGTPALCAPPRLYNQLARTVALKKGMRDVVAISRFFALVNVALADAGIAAWEAKYHYRFWRPVTAIRAGEADKNRLTRKNVAWYPLGSPATNSGGPNFTPPFPAYPSGHAAFGGALFEIMRKYWADDTQFTLVSDEYNGKNKDRYGKVRPLRPATFESFSAAERDNAASRIYLGVHFSFDGRSGIELGNKVADYVYEHAFRPLRHHHQ